MKIVLNGPLRSDGIVCPKSQVNFLSSPELCAALKSRLPEISWDLRFAGEFEYRVYGERNILDDLDGPMDWSKTALPF